MAVAPLSVPSCGRYSDLELGDGWLLEGGDVHLIKPGVAAISVSGNRTSLAGAEQAKTWFEAKGWECRLIPIAEHFLHLDLLMSMVNDRLALVCTDVLEDDVIDQLRGHGVGAIPTTKEAMRLGGFASHSAGTGSSPRRGPAP